MRLHHLLGSFPAVAVALALYAAPTQAATFTVTKTDDTNDGTCDADCSLREAIVAANAAGGPDEVILPAGFYRLFIIGTGEDLSATGDLDVTEELNIVGEGADTTIVDGNGAVTNDRVFDVTAGPGVGLQLTGLTVEGGNVATAGGGIAVGVQNSLIMTDGIVRDNVSNAGGGGGISSSISTVILDNTQVVGNTALGGSGGGIQSSIGVVHVLNGSSVRDNEAGTQGGGVQLSISQLILNDSSVNDNVSSSSGGGIAGAIGDIIADNAEISGNVAESSGGGGITTSLGTIALKKSRMIGNQALGDGNGGAILAVSTIDLSDSALSENRAEGSGGAVFISGPLSSVIAKDSQITGNSSDADGDGGAACDDGPNGNGGSNDEGGGGVFSFQAEVLLSDSVISGNTALTCNGGGLFLSGPSVIERTLIAENTSASDDGGGIFALSDQSSGLVVRSSSIVNNRARGTNNFQNGTDSDGGGVWTDDISDISNTTIAGNEADGNGGGIFSNSSNDAQWNNVTIALNTADANEGGSSEGDGGGVFIADGSVQFVNTIIAGNVDAGSVADAPDCFVFNPSNEAGLISGGANLVQDPTGCLIVGRVESVLNADPLFASDGLADNGGGLPSIALQAGSPALDAGDDASCRPDDQRGTARPQDGNGDGEARCDLGALELTADEIVGGGTTGGDTTGGDTTGGTTGGEDGGGGCTLDPTAQAGSGAAFWLMAALGALLAASRVFGKKAFGRLGLAAMALLFAGSANAATTHHVTDLGDDSPALPGQLRFILQDGGTLDGDTIVFDLDGTITLNPVNGQLNVDKSVSIQGNGRDNTILDAAGGAFRVLEINNAGFGKGAVISGVTITGGNDPSDGAGILINDSGSLTLLDSSVINNTAGGSGGGIRIDNTGSYLLMSGSTVSGNTANGNGGGIDVDDGSAIIENSVIDGNSATLSGGGVNVDDGGLEMTDTKVANNIADSDTNASGNGGGLASDNGAIVLQGTADGSCLVDANTANAADGGGVFNGTTASLSLDHCVVSNNQALADTDGGGIFNEGLLYVTNGSIVSGNQATAAGGGILNTSAAIIDGSTISGNISDSNTAGADGKGGGIFSSDTLSVRNSVFQDNQTNSGEGGAISSSLQVSIDGASFTGNIALANSGGAIFSSTSASIKNAVFSDNHAQGAGSKGGAIASLTSVNVANSTFTGNTADDQGGAIFSINNISANNVTIVGNQTTVGNGGGLFNTLNATLSNSIVAGNTAGSGVGNDCNLSVGKAVLAGPNLIGNPADCGVQGNTEALLTGDPALDTAGLADNGGPTQTIALQEGSPALDAGDADTCEATDQRGVERPQGEGCDLGAFELEVEGGTTGDTTGGDTTGGDTTGGTTGGDSDSGGGCSLITSTSRSEHRAAGSGLIR